MTARELFILTLRIFGIWLLLQALTGLVPFAVGTAALFVDAFEIRSVPGWEYF